MGQVIVVANQKGGVGKTTLVVHLAVWLSRQGRRVIVVDGDPQANATSWLLNGKAARSGLYDLTVARLPLQQCVQVVTANAKRFAEGQWKVGLLPGSSETGDAMVILTALRRAFDTLAAAIRPLAQLADYILVDMPPSKTAGFQELLYAGDWVLIPTQLERLSLEGVVLMARTCKSLAEEHDRGPRLLGVVPNMVRAQTVEHRRQLGELVAAFKTAVWPPIPESIQVAEVTSRGQSMFDYAPGAPATQALELIGRRVLVNTGGTDGDQAR